MTADFPLVRSSIARLLVGRHAEGASDPNMATGFPRWTAQSAGMVQTAGSNRPKEIQCEGSGRDPRLRWSRRCGRVVMGRCAPEDKAHPYDCIFAQAEAGRPEDSDLPNQRLDPHLPLR
jgi:hypothetical protein